LNEPFVIRHRFIIACLAAAIFAAGNAGHSQGGYNNFFGVFYEKGV
jgi:hypothetical protein